MLNNLKWTTLETGRFHTKATLMIYLPPPPPQLSNSFVKLNDTTINYNLRDIETDLAPPRPYTNFLKGGFKNSGAMLWNNLSCEARTEHFPRISEDVRRLPKTSEEDPKMFR